MLSPNINMKAGTNLSRRSSIFQCNRHQIDWTSSINICTISRKRTSALFFEKAYSPCGRRKPPPPQKKKKKEEENKEKELSFFYTFQKLKKRHDTGFYYIHSEITADPCNLIGSNGAIYSQKAPFSSKLHLSPTQWNWKTTQFYKFLKTSSLLDKKSISTD